MTTTATIPSNLRASDGEREQLADALRAHHAAGRLDAEELEQRAAAAYGARTREELDALVADLPSPARGRRRRRPLRHRLLLLPAAVAVVALTGGHALWLLVPALWLARGRS